MLVNISYERHYVYKACLGIEEDKQHEFKGHRTIRMSEIPRICFDKSNQNMSRQPLSSTINAFLNTGEGGTIYVGVFDDGCIVGMHLSFHQMEHIVLNIKDTLDLYTPPVSPHQVKTEFVPVVNDKSELVVNKPEQANKGEIRKHVFGKPKFCWCDLEALNATSFGCICPLYVIEIKVLPYVPKSELNYLQLYIIYENEDHMIFQRKQGSNIKLTLEDVAKITREEVLEKLDALICSQEK